MSRYEICWSTSEGEIGFDDGDDCFDTLHGALAKAEELFRAGKAGVMITDMHREPNSGPDPR